MNITINVLEMILNNIWKLVPVAEDSHFRTLLLYYIREALVFVVVMFGLPYRCAVFWRVWSRSISGRRTGVAEQTSWVPTVRQIMSPLWSASTWSRKRPSSRYRTLRLQYLCSFLTGCDDSHMRTCLLSGMHPGQTKRWCVPQVHAQEQCEHAWDAESRQSTRAAGQKWVRRTLWEDGVSQDVCCASVTKHC